MKGFTGKMDEVEERIPGLEHKVNKLYNSEKENDKYKQNPRKRIFRNSGIL